MFDDDRKRHMAQDCETLARLEVPFSASYLARMMGYEDEVPTCQALWADLAAMVAPRGCDAEKPVCADGTPVEVGDVMRGTGRSQHVYVVVAIGDVNEEVGAAFSVRCVDVDDREIVWCRPELLEHVGEDDEE